MTPCLLYEDEHLLVMNKPAGMNTHAPGPYAGEGLYDWLRHREPRWAQLSIVQRLDKETSGVSVFPKTPIASRSLTGQFTTRMVRKTYLLLTDRPVPGRELAVTSTLVRAGEKYLSRPVYRGGEVAETRFRKPTAEEWRRLCPDGGSAAPPAPFSNSHPLVAEPRTGRTHQIRVHAAEQGFPILGDTLYGGSPGPRVCLHAASLAFRHPVSGAPLVFDAPVDFTADPRLRLREALFDPDETNAYRLIHGASDAWPGWYVDRLGDYLLSQSEQPLDEPRRRKLESLAAVSGARGAYHKNLARQVRRLRPPEASPQPVFGEAAPERFVIRENGLLFEVSFAEGYSVGLFLDQRDNRRRLRAGHVAAGFPLRASNVLNAFAYTCGFSVCAAKAGLGSLSLDLSRKYLEWGQRNFSLNQLSPVGRDFLYGDAFEWLRRLAGKDRSFDAVLLDPPTFSQSRVSGVFQTRKHYGRLVAAALPLLKAGGLLFASTNTADWEPEQFLASVETAVLAAKRSIVQQHFSPQPPDFPISRGEPAYLKTSWMVID
jgi:23S rRNA (cytosine1962-C5)-methyltransferase